MRRSRRLKRKIFWALALSPAVAALCVILAFWYYSHDLPDFRKITDYRPALVTTVLTRDGHVLGYLYKEKRFLVRLEDLPPQLPKAFLAAEDANFYRHEGIDPWAIFRAGIINLKAGGIRQGGSTITQQVVKRLLLSPERSFERKIKEAILAYRLEHYLTKDEILTIYLNQIYLGSNAYGVEAAAREYFGKHAKDLTLAESAVLAGLPQAPSRYNPYADPRAAKVRQRYVLGQMLSQGWITRAQYARAMSQRLSYTSMGDDSSQYGAYYLEEVRRFLIDKFGAKEVYKGGLVVQTACEMPQQIAADNALRRGLADLAKTRGWAGPEGHLTPGAYAGFLANAREGKHLKPGSWVRALVIATSRSRAIVRFGGDIGEIPASTMTWCRNGRKGGSSDPRVILHPGDVIWATVRANEGGERFSLALERSPGPEGALVSIEPETGNVVALSGGFDFEKSQFDRATQARRQPGSAFKPIVYSAALDHGFTPASVILDAPIVFESGQNGNAWRPENYERNFNGPTLLSVALAKSLNVVTIRVAQRIGIKAIIERARALGIAPPFANNLSICLGSSAVTLMDLCQAYTAFPRGGSYVKPRLVLSVKDAWGEQLYASHPEFVQAISPQNAYLMVSMLKGVITMGTGRAASALGRPLAGKTGTTNNEQDAWFIGFTPHLLSGVYVGYDHVRPMGRGNTGAHAALPIWLMYRQAIEGRYPPDDFAPPQGIVWAHVGGGAPQAAEDNATVPESGGGYFLPFAEGTQPAQTEASPPAASDEGNETSDEDLMKQAF